MTYHDEKMGSRVGGAPGQVSQGPGRAWYRGRRAAPGLRHRVGLKVGGQRRWGRVP